MSILKEKTTEFIQINLTSVPPIQIVWEAFKATCRGWIISYATAKKKRMGMKENSFILKTKTLESQHLRDPKNIRFKNVPDVYSYYLAYNARFPLLWAYTGQSELGS